MSSAPAAGSAPASRLVLAIDLGTSGPKVALVDDSGRVLTSAVRPNAMHLLPGGGAEQDRESGGAASSMPPARWFERPG